MKQMKNFSEVIVKLCNWAIKHEVDLNDCSIEIDAQFDVSTMEPKGDDVLSQIIPWVVINNDDIERAKFEIWDKSGVGFECIFGFGEWLCFNLVRLDKLDEFDD